MMKLLTLLAVLLIPGIIHAENLSSQTRSAGKLVADSSVDLTEKLANSELLQIDDSIQPVKQLKPAVSARTTNHSLEVEFEIFDAWVELSGDIDHDGFYHRIKTTFDADVNTSVETVYAKLYISYEGGSWRQFADSDLFEIYYDSANDTYEIISELIDGYPPGFYDVLIELHSLYHPGIVASHIIYQDSAGFSITLEDMDNDVYYAEPESYVVTDLYVGAGSMSWVGIILLGLLLLVKIRYFPNNRP